MNNKSKPQVITVYLSKGGVAKSTIAALLAKYLAGQGFRAVLFDLDRQGGQSYIFDYLDDLGRPIQIMDRVLRGEVDILSALIDVNEHISRFSNVEAGSLHLVPGGALTPTAIDDVKSNPLRFGLSNTLDIIRRPVNALSGHADFVIVDIGPSDSLLSAGALVATDHLIMPTEMEAESVAQIEAVLDEVDAALSANPNLDILGLVPVKVRKFFGGFRLSRGAQIGQAILRESYSDIVLRDDAGEIQLAYDDDWGLVRWGGDDWLTADYVKAGVKNEALRFLRAVCERAGVVAHA